jgi:hypothetical protein
MDLAIGGRRRCWPRVLDPCTANGRREECHPGSAAQPSVALHSVRHIICLSACWSSGVLGWGGALPLARRAHQRSHVFRF